MQDQLQALKDQQVEIVYNGMVYKGRLAGLSEDEAHLQTREQWISLPLEGITSVKKASDSGTGFPGYQGPGAPSQ